jgi:hypothetical protein
MSTPLHWFLGTALGDPQARAAFTGWVLEHPAGRSIPIAQRHDVLQDVALHYLAQAPRIVERLSDASIIADLAAGRAVKSTALDAANRRLDAYVRRSLHNRYKTLIRRSGHTWVQLSDEIEDPRGLAFGDPAELALRMLERVEAYALEHCPGNRADTERVLDELKGLAMGHWRMDDLIAREAPGELTEPARVRARDRLYVRHRRMRECLRKAVDALESSGELSPDDAECARLVVDQVLRRRQTNHR